MARKKEAKARGVYEKVPGSGIWSIQYFDRGVRKRETVGNKQDAIDLRKIRMAAIVQGERLPELGRRRVTIATLCDLGLRYAEEHNRTAADYRTKAALVKTNLGTRFADEIAPGEIAAWIKSRNGSNATFNRYRAFISLCYREGMRERMVTSNTAHLIPMKRESKGRKRFLTYDEYDAVYAAIVGEDRKEAFAVSVYTGMRLTEQMTCAWYQVDFDRNEINLEKTKNGEDRTIKMNSMVRSLLWERKVRVGGKRKDLVFPGNTAGGRATTRWWFQPALKIAGIEDYVWHGNRHTFCSWNAMAGVQLKTLQEMAGHKTLSITAQYSHLMPDHMADEAEKILHRPVRKNVLTFPVAVPTATQTATFENTTRLSPLAVTA